MDMSWRMFRNGVWASHSQAQCSLKVLKSSLLLILVVKMVRRRQAALHDPCSLRAKGVSWAMLGERPGARGTRVSRPWGGGGRERACVRFLLQPQRCWAVYLPIPTHPPTPLPTSPGVRPPSALRFCRVVLRLARRQLLLSGTLG